MKIYISGKITGDRRYKAKFREVEKKLAAAGHIVLNPATAPEGLRPADSVHAGLPGQPQRHAGMGVVPVRWETDLFRPGGVWRCGRMSIICIAKGTATIGMTTRGADGKIISQTPARWEHDPDGGCVALWTMNPETEEQEAPARIYGDWQASEYLGDVLAELKPRRKVNLPDFPAIVRAAMADGMDICVYCQSFGCNECIVNEWKSERSDEE